MKDEDGLKYKGWRMKNERMTEEWRMHDEDELEYTGWRWTGV